MIDITLTIIIFLLGISVIGFFVSLAFVKKTLTPMLSFCIAVNGLNILIQVLILLDNLKER